MKLIIAKEQIYFLDRNAVITDSEHKREYALPVFTHFMTDPDEVFSMENFIPSEFAVQNANKYLKLTVAERGKISDGYHTFDELYEHRILNFILACKTLNVDEYAPIWKSRAHSDGSVWDGWFIMGINSEPGEQLTYHIPEKYWELTKFATEYDTAPPFDGHTSADVLTRLMKLIEELD